MDTNYLKQMIHDEAVGKFSINGKFHFQIMKKRVKIIKNCFKLKNSKNLKIQ
ncbi:uridine-cytidine kinase [Lactobacillus phage S16]|nr:uridine-cytidine kinase [Lactobacillus phage S16]